MVNPVVSNTYSDYRMEEKEVALRTICRSVSWERIKYDIVKNAKRITTNVLPYNEKTKI